MERNRLLAAGERFASGGAQLLQRHPRHLTALLAALLLGGGGGAFAVASFGPDPADLPVRQVREQVEPLPIEAQLEALDVHALRLFRSDVLRPTDTVESLLSRLGLHDPAAAAYLRQDAAFRTQILGRPGRLVTAEANDQHALEKLIARWPSEEAGEFRRLIIERAGDGRLSTRVETGQLTASTRLGSGTIRSSLFAAVDEARIPDEIAVQVADILGGRVDFHRGLRKGDWFNVVYEVLVADGEPMRTGRVLSVEFINNGKSHTAMWFQQPGRKGAYFDLDGSALQSAYLASPMEFSRVTSGFSMRFHPVLKQWRAHLGTDYGAPTGTPVRSVGDGTVEFAGWQNGFGNVVTIRHNASDVTLYAHLSRIAVRKGQSVSQGQNVGAVGATGWATGPHLHFEFRKNGEHQDPQVVARKAEGAKLAADALPAFRSASVAMRLKLDAAASAAQVASIE
ncbi:M23 family metallopeptidase [Ramlibacter rhizophilus]|uniref:M23 family metallopeptidase n=1 Tax=Ramlibacter rhizophilus TaxID=1781167 RepID=A0A4Z0BNN3_9BURK|nr:M23 family metallopeptidase [Ramlibacter rhizophilus]TFY99538.1 M23 family metallopeptidase [Ramlibacter rhizophilus]